jgi:hypothetical protein
MTIAQLAKVAYPNSERPSVISRRNLKGEVVSEIRYPPGYQMTRRILQTLASTKDSRGQRKKAQVKCSPSPYHGYPDLWMLPTTNRLRFGLYEHEIICADVYVSYRACECWCEPNGANLQALKLEPDRHMIWSGLHIFWEIDRGTESPKIIKDKMEKYIRYKEEIGKFFYVVFVVQDYSKHPDLKLLKGDQERREAQKKMQYKRAMEIDSAAAQMKAGNQFLYTSQEWIVNKPFSQILCSPLEVAFSINELK